MTVTTSSTASTAPAKSGRGRKRRSEVRKTSLLAHGEPMVWLTGGALVVAIAMIVSLLFAVVWFGGRTFWPQPVESYALNDSSILMGEVSRQESFTPEEGAIEIYDETTVGVAQAELAASEGTIGRTLVRQGNKDLTGAPFRWILDAQVAERSQPEWALVVERILDGRFYGTPVEFRVDGEVTETEPEAIWAAFQAVHGESRERFHEQARIDRHDIGAVLAKEERARLAIRKAELRHGADSEQVAAATAEFETVKAEAAEDFEALRAETSALEAENARYQMVVEAADGRQASLIAAEVVRAYPANQLSWGDKLGVYLSRWWEFLSDGPREANTEGGVLPAIFGTVIMTMLMSVMVVPFGVLAALYLREYAKQGMIISIVRIAVNNLAGVPSIVFGVFGLGFFCYLIGGTIDDIFFAERLPRPTYGKAALIWASLTLALLTLPVVIVATGEALAAVPNSMREGSYACGATKWQTIRRIVLPRAAPGIMTGTILAIARGAGEVAPLMVVGAVKFAKELAVDGTFPYIHPERSFMHLGFHIFDLGFQSPDSESAKPMVFTTTLLLIAIVVLLNFTAIGIRARLRRRYSVGSV